MSEESRLVLVAWLAGVALPAASLCSCARLRKLQRAGDGRAAARAFRAAPASRSAPAPPERPASARSHEPAAAPLALELMRRDAHDSAALAPARCCPPLDLRSPRRPPARRRRDPRAPRPARAREPALGLPADRRRDQRAGLKVSVTTVGKILRRGASVRPVSVPASRGGRS